MHGLLDVEFDASLVENVELLDKVTAHNSAQNEMRTGTPDEIMTYLLAQVKSLLTLFARGRARTEDER